MCMTQVTFAENPQMKKNGYLIHIKVLIVPVKGIVENSVKKKREYINYILML